MKTKIILEDIEVHAYHGCYKEEQIVGNRFLVSISYVYDASEASKTDDITKTVNYLELCKTVKKEMAITSFIIENVAKRIIDRLFLDFPLIDELEVKLSKCNPPLGGLVGKASVIMSDVRKV
ncbi:MAG: dihydroneopterin aldolase [Bacteroidetes bacterium]|nr:dihydroneopterin aldolase [Bacteroidota bacterium]